MEFLIAVLLFTGTVFVIGYVVGSNNASKTYHGRVSTSSKKQETIEEPLEVQFLNASQSSFYGLQNLLNQSEISIYWTLINLLKGKYLINPQVSLGEILSCNDNLGYRAINSKRVDFVITDKGFRPIAVVEFQGKGHYQGDHRIRDAVKYNALNRAGVKYIEVFTNQKDEIHKALAKHGLLNETY